MGETEHAVGGTLYWFQKENIREAILANGNLRENQAFFDAFLHAPTAIVPRVWKCLLTCLFLHQIISISGAGAGSSSVFLVVLSPAAVTKTISDEVRWKCLLSVHFADLFSPWEEGCAQQG